MTRASLFAAAILAFLPTPATPAPPPVREVSVSARLISNAAAIAPGTPFLVGIELTMGPGWHTYWKNGGDAGYATSVEWTLPEGFTVSELRWPVPHRYEDEGEIVSFGYEKKALLLAEVTPPEELSSESGEIVLRADTDWLQCRDLCTPGSALLVLRLPVEETARPATGRIADAFREGIARVPLSEASLPGLTVRPFQSVDAVVPGDSVRVAAVLSGLVSVASDEVEFFPGPSDELWFRDALIRWDGENLGVVIPVEVDLSAESGSTLILTGTLRIPTDAEPLLLDIALPVRIAASAHTPSPTPAAVFSGGGNLLGETRAASGQSLLRILLLAFLGGIILNVMPCVLPVVSLKILSFVSHAGEDPRKVFRLGLMFAAGILVSFFVFAMAVVAMQAAGEQVGWGFQFQNPVFVAVMTAVIFLFALSLFGVFEIVLPVSFGGGRERGAYADAFFNGVLATILATPCTAPMLGTALAFAFSQPPGVILLVFLVIGAGLAFPYVLLSSHPAWLRFLPRPGTWMETFKQFMGFILLATMVWLLSVYGALTGPSGMTWFLAFLVLLGFIAWLHGRFLGLASSTQRRLIVWGVSAMLLAWGYSGLLSGTMEPEDGAHTGGVEVTKGGIAWEPFSHEALDRAMADGRTVLIDFTADWCLTCKVNEKTVLADADVEAKLHEYNIVTLKGDWTRKDPVISEVLRRHNRSGVPFYAVYPAGRPEDVIVLPEVITRKIVLDSLEKAGPSRSGRSAEDAS